MWSRHSKKKDIFDLSSKDEKVRKHPKYCGVGFDFSHGGDGGVCVPRMRRRRVRVGRVVDGK